MKILFVYPNEMLLNPPPIGIGILSALLNQEGFELDLFDTTYYSTFSQSSDKAKENNLQVRPFSFGERNASLKQTDLFEDLTLKLETFCPDLIAISILEPTFSQALSMLDFIADYDIPIIAGGVFPTFAPEQTLAHRAIDIICIGEGEGALLELCIGMRDNRDISGIRNLWLKTKKGDIVRNSLRPVIKLDEMPIPDYSLFEPERFLRPMAGNVYRAIPIETNRGCPFGCAYCNSPSQTKLYRNHGAGNFFRKKGMDRIHEEIRVLSSKYDAEYIYFSSDTFLTMTDKEFDHFIDLYKKIQLPFWIQTRPETITRKRVMALKDVGCHRMSMGVEHGNYEFRKNVLNKDIPNKVIITASRLIAEAGIPLTVNNILGFPGENRELIFDTIELNRQLEFDTTNAYAFAPFHGTHLHEVCIKKGFLSENRLIRNLTIDAGLDMPELTKKEIGGLRKTFAMYARLPKKYWPKIQIAEGDDEAANRAFEKLRNVYIDKYFKA